MRFACLYLLAALSMALATPAPAPAPIIDPATLPLLPRQACAGQNIPNCTCACTCGEGVSNLIPDCALPKGRK
ncbi:hypothetical protein B0H14DRAFT_2696619, partial [Mycena olivaceomarginata]